MRHLARPAAYVAVAFAVVIPGVMRAGGGIPGSPRSDLWNSLWSLWFAAHHGPGGWTTLLDAPGGGTIWVADPLDGLLLAPLTSSLGVVAAWWVLVVVHLALAGFAADRLAADLGADRAGAWVAGLGFATSALLASAVHNATSEALAWGWVPLALLALRRSDRGRRASVLAIVALVAAGLASAYLAVVTWTLAAALIALDPRDRVRRASLLAVATAVVLPWDAFLAAAVTAPDSLVAIKDPLEVAEVRRTIGALDPRVLVVPGRFRSPDFARISRYGEDFVHCVYLGWVWLALAIAAVARGRGRWLAVGALVLAALACGPVLVADGQPVLFGERPLAVPLPYLIVERLPGFRSLSLVFRLAGGASLAVCVLAGLAARGRAGWIALAFGLLEATTVSPMAGGPDGASLPDATALRALRDAPPGAVLDLPLEAGRPTLWEATVHGHPLAATLNFPANGAALDVLRVVADRGVDAGVARARSVGLRYLVLHVDPKAAPSVHDEAIAALAAAARPVASTPMMEVRALW